MRNLFALIEKVAPYNSTILIQGESGSGKELVARVIHERSPRKEGPFVAVNCGAIPATLLESELFGYQKGAFTGADRDRTGLIEEAGGGTLFLDEIAELPLDLQVKLLRVLEEGKVLPLGSSRPRPVEVRWIAATHKDLEEVVQSGRFRHDLYYRLKVIEIRVPPLRQRREDIPLLAGEWLFSLNERYQKGIEGIEPPAVSALLDYPWHGNVRELQNILERAYILTEGKWITREALSALLSEGVGDKSPERVPEDLDLPRAIQELEVRYITEALRRTRGNRTRAAKLLRISHRALLYKIKEYRIDPEGGSHPGSETASSPRSEPHNAGGSPD
jgi:two-component system response regulator AtoC